MKKLRQIHFFLGIIVIITFLSTGLFMHFKYNHLIDMELTKRALFRTGHIYILLFGLVNLSLGNYLKIGSSKAKTITQKIGSVLIIVASVIIIVSFFTENPTINIERGLSRLAIYFITAGVIFHSIPIKKINSLT